MPLETVTVTETVKAPVAVPTAEALKVDTKADATKTETKPAEPKKEKDSSKWNALLTREQKLVQEKETAKKAQAEALTAKTEAEALKKEVQAEKDKLAALKKDPKKFLEATGMTYDELVGSMMNGGVPTPEMQARALKDEMIAIKEENDKKWSTKEKEDEAAAQKVVESKIQEFHETTLEKITKDTEKYSLVNAFGLAQQVSHAAYQAFEKTGAMKDPDEIAAEMEADIEKRMPDILEGALKSTKLMAAVKKIIAKLEGGVVATNEKGKTESNLGAPVKKPTFKITPVSNDMGPKTTVEAVRVKKTPQDNWKKLLEKMTPAKT